MPAAGRHRRGGAVAGLVRAACGLWPGFSGDLVGSAFAASEAVTASGIRAGAGGQVMLICGPACVGKSAVGFQFYLRCLRAGLAASYVDLDQISFVRPAHPDDAAGHRLKARNLAAIWQNYRAAGATHLIATGPIDNAQSLRAHAAEIPAALTLMGTSGSPAPGEMPDAGDSSPVAAGG